MQDPAPLFSLDQYRVEDSIGYLLARSRTKIAKSVDEALAQCGITYAQGSIVYMLSTGKYATAADLSRELYIDAGSMKRMLDRLVLRNLIARTPSIADRRSIGAISQESRHGQRYLLDPPAQQNLTAQYLQRLQ